MMSHDYLITKMAVIVGGEFVQRVIVKIDNKPHDTCAYIRLGDTNHWTLGFHTFCGYICYCLQVPFCSLYVRTAGRYNYFCIIFLHNAKCTYLNIYMAFLHWFAFCPIYCFPDLYCYTGSEKTAHLGISICFNRETNAQPL